MRYLLMSVLLLLTPMLAQAQDDAEYFPEGTRINLSASAEMVLPNDEVIVSFRVEKQGKDADAVRSYVNKVSGAIEQRLKQEADVKLKTLSRNMQPVWKYVKNSPRVRVGWQMTQSGQISTTNLKAVPKWLDAIESAGAHLSNLNFRVSDAISKQAMESLRRQAIANFRSKAAGMAKGLDAESFRIIRLNTSGQAPQPRIYRAEMAMMAKASADNAQPALSAGENKITVTVSGEIEVPFIDYPAK